MSCSDTRTDPQLVRSVLEGNQADYRPLVERYQAPLYRFALGMVADAAVASDMVQETFIKAYESLARCRKPERFQSWLFQILRNRCRDHLKAPRRKSVALEDSPNLVADDSPSHDLERSLLSDEIQRALAELPEAQREAFLLKHLEGYSYEEMAEMCGTSVGALKMRVARARETLRILLGGLLRTVT